MIRHFLAGGNFASEFSAVKNSVKKYILPKLLGGQFVFCVLAVGFVLFPITTNSQPSPMVGSVVKTNGNFLLIRDGKVLVNIIPGNIIYENDKIITLKDGYVGFVLLHRKELTAIRPYSNITIVKGSNKLLKLKEVVTKTFCLLWGKSPNDFFEPIGSAVAGVKG